MHCKRVTHSNHINIDSFVFVLNKAGILKFRKKNQDFKPKTGAYNQWKKQLIGEKTEDYQLSEMLNYHFWLFWFVDLSNNDYLLIILLIYWERCCKTDRFIRKCWYEKAQTEKAHTHTAQREKQVVLRDRKRWKGLR